MQPSDLHEYSSVIIHHVLSNYDANSTSNVAVHTTCVHHVHVFIYPTIKYRHFVYSTNNNYRMQNFGNLEFI